EIFEPKLGLVGLLKKAVQLGAELGIGAGAGGFAGMRGDGGSGADHLPGEQADLFPLPGKLQINPDNRGAEHLGPQPQLLRQPHLPDFAISPPSSPSFSAPAISAFQLLKISASTPHPPFPMTKASNPCSLSEAVGRTARPSKTK